MARCRVSENVDLYTDPAWWRRMCYDEEDEVADILIIGVRCNYARMRKDGRLVLTRSLRLKFSKFRQEIHGSRCVNSVRWLERSWTRVRETHFRRHASRVTHHVPPHRYEDTRRLLQYSSIHGSALAVTPLSFFSVPYRHCRSFRFASA